MTRQANIAAIISLLIILSFSSCKKAENPVNPSCGGPCRWTIAFLYRTFATSDVSVRRLRTIFPEGSDMVDLDGPIFGEGPPSWSPDRRFILYDKVSDNGGVIYRVMNFSIRMSYPLKTDSLVVNAGN